MPQTNMKSVCLMTNLNHFLQWWHIYRLYGGNHRIRRWTAVIPGAVCVCCQHTIPSCCTIGAFTVSALWGCFVLPDWVQGRICAWYHVAPAVLLVLLCVHECNLACHSTYVCLWISVCHGESTDIARQTEGSNREKEEKLNVDHNVSALNYTSAG